MIFIITLIMTFMAFKFVLLPLRISVIKKYGGIGDVWFYRLFYLSAFSLGVITHDNSIIDNVLVWVFGVLLTLNMIIYNPWSIHKVIAYSEAKIKEMQDMQDNDDEGLL